MSPGLDDEAVTDPIGVIVRLIADVEHGLDLGRIREVATESAGRRAGRRRLARALMDNPQVLRTGRPPAIWSAGKLLLALRKAGALGISPPRCCACGKDLTSLRCRSGGDWGCTPCLDEHEECAGCGEKRRVVSRDRHGLARCQNCPDADGDPMETMTQLIIDLDPAVSREEIETAVQRATVRPAGQRRLAWAIIERPDLLTGAGTYAPAPAVLRFIDELVAAGTSKVVRPACPRCHEVKALSKLLAGQRICRNCFARTAAVPCCRCGSVREPAARDADGGPLCPNCLVSDPVNHEECAACGRRTRVAVRTPDGPLCVACMPRQILDCGICGRTAPCEVSRATGEPWCDRCQQKWVTCSGCGAVAQIRSGTLQEPLCAQCLNPDPHFWGRCPACEVTWQLSPRPCLRCTLDQRVRGFLDDGTGFIRPDLAPLHHALTGVERPDTAMAWLSRPRVGELLSALGDDRRQVSHETLDELPAGKTLAHLRSVLVAIGALPVRDQRLAELEHWTAALLDAREDPGDRRILHGYAIWHHLRRLRRRIGEQHVSHLQALNVRCHVTAAANFLDWLAAGEVTLASCTQADLDRWASGEVSYRDATAHFIRWSVSRRHATGLTFGATRWEGPRGPHDGEKRWDDARRLLHDGTLKTPDRVAGLLLLLYAQHIATISQLTADDVHDDGATLKITFGTSPVIVPEPLAGLVRELIATRKGSNIINAPGARPWLFPGRRPGHPLGDDRLGQRLQQIGLKPRQDRSTAMFTLATELPAAILARLPGIHIKVAVQWQRASAGDWMTYAADVSRRTDKT